MPKRLLIATVCWGLATFGLVANRVLFPDVLSGSVTALLLGWLLWTGLMSFFIYRDWRRRGRS